MQQSHTGLFDPQIFAHTNIAVFFAFEIQIWLPIPDKLILYISYYVFLKIHHVMYGIHLFSWRVY